VMAALQAGKKEEKKLGKEKIGFCFYLFFEEEILWIFFSFVLEEFRV